jgi:hypothetical protein
MVREGEAGLDDQPTPRRDGSAGGADGEGSKRRLDTGMRAVEDAGGGCEHLERPGEVQDLDVVEEVDTDVTHGGPSSLSA